MFRKENKYYLGLLIGYLHVYINITQTRNNITEIDNVIKK